MKKCMRLLSFAMAVIFLVNNIPIEMFAESSLQEAEQIRREAILVGEDDSSARGNVEDQIILPQDDIEDKANNEEEDEEKDDTLGQKDSDKESKNEEEHVLTNEQFAERVVFNDYDESLFYLEDYILNKSVYLNADMQENIMHSLDQERELDASDFGLDSNSYQLLDYQISDDFGMERAKG